MTAFFSLFLSETFRAGIGRFTPIAITCSSIKFTPRYPSLWSRRIKIPARRHHQSMKNKRSRVINHTAVRSLRTIVSIDNEYIELNIDLQLVRHLLSSPLVAIHFFCFGIGSTYIFIGRHRHKSKQYKARTLIHTLTRISPSLTVDTHPQYHESLRVEEHRIGKYVPVDHRTSSIKVMHYLPTAVSNNDIIVFLNYFNEWSVFW